MITLRDYQQECIDAFYNYYATGQGRNGLIVVPTAGGKSLIIGGLVSEICQRWPGQRILILSHVFELIKQNHEKVMLCWPNAPAGIYNAALGKRQAHHPVVVGSIQSVYKKAAMLGHRDLLFIDEAHLLQPGNMGMYGTLIAALLAINPFMKVCGFTATDYRTDSGLLTEGEGALFNDVIIEISIQRLLDEGYLTPPVGKQSIVQANMEGVKKTAGEFNIKEMAARFDQRMFIKAAIDSDMPFFEGTAPHTRKRNSIALFCATIENAQHVADVMIEHGIACEVMHGELPTDQREDILRRFRSGELRSVVSVGTMTTGTDVPNIDCIVLFRATASPGLYQQIIGRGFRVLYGEGFDLHTIQGRIDAIMHGGKPDFLVLDHGSNIERHGPLTAVDKPRKKDKGAKVPLPKPKARICKICRTAWPLEITVCGTCGKIMVVERDPTSNLNIEASNAEILGTAFTRGEAAFWFDVENVRYTRHQKKGGMDSMRVTYYHGLMQFDEWIHFEAPNDSMTLQDANRQRMMQGKGKHWWMIRSGGAWPSNLKEALDWSPTLIKPAKVLVRKKIGKNGKSSFYEVLNYEFTARGTQRADHAAAAGA